MSASMLSKANLLPFVKNYFRHPFFKEAEIQDPYIRVTYAYSDYTRKILEKRGELDAARHTWHAADRIYSRSDFKERALPELLRSCDQGLDVYYNVNISPRDFGRVGNIPLDMHAKRVRSEHVTNCLFIPIDWDNDLPCGVGKINSELGITPAAIVRSSNRKALPTGLGESGMGHRPRYQMLIAVDPSDSREYDYWLAITRLAAHVLGADPSSAALNKLFRFPGTVNWKQFEEHKKKDFSILMPQPQPDGGGPDIGDYPVYTLKDLKNIFENFKRNDLSRLLREAAPNYRDSTRVVTDALLDGRKKPRLVDVTWEEALVIGEGIPGSKDPKKRIGKPVVEKGERHNALISWAGALAVEVGSGLYTLDEAGDLLRRLAMHACAWSSSESDEAAKELYGATRYLNECSFKEDRKRVESLKKMLSGYTDPSSDSDSSDDSVALDKRVGALKKGQKTMYAILTTKLDEFCSPLKDESQDTWFNFLALFFREIQSVSDSTGNVTKLVGILMDRAEELKLLQDIGFFLPAEATTAWGTRAFILKQLTNAQLENYCSISVERLVAACLESREILQKSAIFGPVVKRIKIAAEEEAMISPTEIDQALYEKTLKAKLRKYFDLKLTDQLKNVVVKAWLKTITSWVEDRDAQEDDQAVFQNGVLKYSEGSGVFISDSNAWRNSRYALHCDFLPGLATQLNSPSLSVEELESLLEREIPLFSAFMRSAFPDDVEAWVIMLRIVGYCFIVNNPFDVFFSFYGESGAGKGTMWRLITALIGDADNSSGLTYDLDFFIAAKGMGGFVNAVGKLAVNIDEAESKDASIHDRVFREVNRITSGQKVQVEEKWKTTEHRRIGAKLIFTANKPFLFDDAKGAIERRMVALHFAQVITHQNPNLLKDILSAGEANKIATLGAVLCARAWKKGKGMFDGSKATTEGRAELIESMNPLKGILRKFIISSDKITDYIELPEIAKLVEKYSERLSVAEQEKIQWLLAGGDIAVNRGIAGEMKRCGLITELRRMNVTDEATLTRKKVSVCTKVKWNESALKFAGLIET